MLELHCHSTYSDGTLSPSELVAAAANAGVRALAVTDHDTLNGWDEAFAAGTAYNIEIIPGLELSTVHNNCALHILGFYPDRKKLRVLLQERLQARHRRAQQMIAKLSTLGYPITLPEMAPGMAPGRPHLAAALVQAGHVRSIDEAFDRLLRDNGPAYVPYEKFSISEGINLLIRCGAVPVWAHPYLFRGGKVEAVLLEMLADGLMGIEVYHPNHTPTQIEHLESFCLQHGLLKTGGSDYHGPSSDAKGHRLNMWHLPLYLLDPIKSAAAIIAEQKY
ncbi:MAG: PHP domain-containing protein [Hormoscilla sp. GUM202]|nr:PHP domain-containing protein [Hormoscilla sp. GUM202]